MLMRFYTPYWTADKGKAGSPTGTSSSAVGDEAQTGNDQAKNGNGDSQARTFTQEQVNEIVGERLKRAEESAARKLLEALSEKEAALAKAQRQNLQIAIRAEALKQQFEEGELNSVWLTVQNDATLFALAQAQADDDDWAGLEQAVKQVADAHPRWLKTQKVALGTPPRRTPNNKQPVEQPGRPLVNF